VTDIPVSPSDFYGYAPYWLGYPPYAVDGCSLVFVTPAGDLVLRDLAAGTEATIASASEQPRRPAIAGDLVAWEATVNGKPMVRVREGDHTTTIDGPFNHAGEPRVAPGAVVFTGWLAENDLGDTDVFLYDTHCVTKVRSGPGQQRFADISSTHIAWSDFSEGQTGVFMDADGDAADIEVYDRSSNAIYKRKELGKQAFPLLGAEGKLAYLDWGTVHPEPKFSEYDVYIADIAQAASTANLVTHIQTTELYLRPTAHGTQIDWVVSNAGTPALFHRPVDLSSPAVQLDTMGSTELYGPVATSGMAIVASRSNGAASLVLRAVSQ
jgi:hypothetical protein